MGKAQMTQRVKITWLKEPEAHDYPAAASYLSLIYDPRLTKALVTKLKRVPIVEYKSKDIFRASGLPLLPLGNAHVKQDEKKIMARRALSPLLLVRDPGNGRVVIADGYHRLCAVYAFDEDVVVPCKIV
jgi:hypothetical protein